MEQSDNLALPYIVSSQDQKHITHNEALNMLDALLHLSVLEKDLTVPPVDPAAGDRHLVGASATGDWTGRDNHVAAWQNGGWVFYLPQAGWRVWVESEQRLLAWDQAQWVSPLDKIQNASFIGINATADVSNRLVLNAGASLFNHDGAGHQIKINKNQSTDTGSVLYQSNWSGRAEMGLAGSDAFQIKVSADGTSWSQVFNADPATGIASLPSGANSSEVTLTDDAFVSLDLKQMSGVIMLWCADETTPDTSGGRFALFYFDASALPAIVAINADAFVTLETGIAPTGTTGLDQYLTIRADSGKFHIENRRGGTHRYRWMLLN
ncbi:DUF2793 domain-containing protein [Cohaesibacter celericrescens]|uniref:Uncharacterized protein n=1 Tax=Cohaesibacter celericrescens TaxID=2067669 RepID=A0A2N5XQY8_9HYPH|nr:DUF2793 domain-containing protein [Cohaesibacter celericrescens]PLW76885.1 hypothetical protein C0081_12570 [Cohaesibacter celericrescens]